MSWLIKSSIGRKFVQSISGLFLILFLLFHAAMNLVLIFNYETYNFLANEMLGANWWAIVGTIVIFFGFGVHIIYSIILTIQNRKARGNIRYASSSKNNATWSSKNMFRSEEHTSELQSRPHLVCRLLLEKKNKTEMKNTTRSPASHPASRPTTAQGERSYNAEPKKRTECTNGDESLIQYQLATTSPVSTP